MRARLYVVGNDGLEIASKQVNLSAREGCLMLPNGRSMLRVRRSGVVGRVMVYLSGIDKGVECRSDLLPSGLRATIGDTITIVCDRPIVIVGACGAS